MKLKEIPILCLPWLFLLALVFLTGCEEEKEAAKKEAKRKIANQEALSKDPEFIGIAKDGRKLYRYHLDGNDKSIYFFENEQPLD